MQNPQAPSFERTHFVGVAGTGMSALALYLSGKGLRVSGSDRALDNGTHEDVRARLEAAGIEITPQNGSGIDKNVRVVTSTAVEAAISDLVKAHKLGLNVLHRSELLGLIANDATTIAITGTNGKSTVVGMVFQILRSAGRDPSVLTGGPLLCLEGPANIGNAYAGTGPLVIEADESDKSLVQYHPQVGVILNLERDHDEPEAFLDAFRLFCNQTRERVVLGPSRRLDAFRENALSFDFCDNANAALTAHDIHLHTNSAQFILSLDEATVPFTLNQPGEHNVHNAVAAVAACVAIGIPLRDCQKGLAEFSGLYRRLQRRSPDDAAIEVFDDFAHNPWKIAAAVKTACSRSERVWAVFQPHGFAPARLMRDELVQQLKPILRPNDRFFLSEIYFAGGSAKKTLSSRDLVNDLNEAGVSATFSETLADIGRIIRAEAQPGDVVLVMGARDPALSELAHELGRECLRE